MFVRKCLPVFRAAVTALLILSAAIAAPILLRPFYYLHIKPMGLGEDMLLTAGQVKTAYNEMMNYCTGLSSTFSVGVLGWSESGFAHFADVRKLFLLDLGVLAGSAIALILIAVFQRKNRNPLCLGGHTPGFWGAIGLGGAFLVVGGLAALDFDRAFVIFHELFFPGKSNWVFDGYEDPIIYLLPWQFFRNCAIFILAVILISSISLIIRDFRLRKINGKQGA